MGWCGCKAEGLGHGCVEEKEEARRAWLGRRERGKGDEPRKEGKEERPRETGPWKRRGMMAAQ